MPLRDLLCTAPTCGHVTESLVPHGTGSEAVIAGGCGACGSDAVTQTGTFAIGGLATLRKIPREVIPKKPENVPTATKRRDLQCVTCNLAFEADVTSDVVPGDIAEVKCLKKRCKGTTARVLVSIPHAALTTREFLGSKEFHRRMKKRCKDDQIEAVGADPEKHGFVAKNRPNKTWRASLKRSKKTSTRTRVA